MNITVAVIDDDPFVVTYIRKAFMKRMPEAEVHAVYQAIAPAGYDIYIVGKDFEGKNKGGDLARRIRGIEPAAIILGYTAALDQGFLHLLLEAGCDGAFDKANVDQLDAMIDVIQKHVSHRKDHSNRLLRTTSLIDAIRNLVREWNTRLSSDMDSKAR
jgi:DNA-binding NarL/FixJ family response regulator